MFLLMMLKPLHNGFSECHVERFVFEADVAVVADKSAVVTLDDAGSMMQAEATAISSIGLNLIFEVGGAV